MIRPVNTYAQGRRGYSGGVEEPTEQHYPARTGDAPRSTTWTMATGAVLVFETGKATTS